MRYVFIGLFCIFIFNNAYAKTVDELVKKIANSTPTMKYLFWVAKDESSKNVPYLTLKKKSGGFAVWHFTSDKKWQPIHNTGKFNNFPKADGVFVSVSLDKIKEAITFGAISNAPVNDSANQKAKILESKDFNIGWYFWVNNKDAFLFRAKKNKEISIWYFTSDKKWQPIHNASGFDGFDKAEKNFDSVSFEPSTGVLTIGKSMSPENDPPSEPPSENKPTLPKGLTLTSSDITAGEFLDEAYATTISPSLSWDVIGDIKNKNIIKSYAISLKDLNVNKYHWNVINIPSSVTSLPKGASFNYENSKNIPNDFGSSSYVGPFPPVGDTHGYEFSVYGFVASSIGGSQDYKNAIYKSSIKVKFTGK